MSDVLGYVAEELGCDDMVLCDGMDELHGMMWAVVRSGE